MRKRDDMPATIAEPESVPERSATEQTDKKTERQLPDASLLEDRFPQWFRTTPRLTLFVGLLGVLFFFFSYRPLWHTDLWGHLAYGRLIWQSGEIPATEPFMPLAEGVPLVDTAWLSQLFGYGVQSALGNAGLQFFYAAAITLCLGLLAWRFHDRTRSVAWTLLGLATFLAIEWKSLMIIRPQLAGLCCFVALLTILTSRGQKSADLVVTAVLMVLWANLHGSFVVGLLMLATFFVGRAFDVFRRTGRLRAVWKDRRTRWMFLLTEIAAVAVLLNPYGIRLYAEALSFAGQANLADLADWQPLTLRMWQGRAFFAVAAVLIVLFRYSPRRVSTSEALLLLGLGAAALWTSRMVVWWGPVAAYSLVLHGHAVFRRWLPQVRDRAVPHRRSLWTVASLGLVWICVAYTPLGLQLLHGAEPPLERTVSGQTPIGATQYLNEHPPTGQIYNPYEWGDYLVWDGPKNLQVFVTSHAHLVPRKVWNDYFNVERFRLMDRYGINTIVISPHEHKEFADALRKDNAWRLDYEDERSIIFSRKRPIAVKEQPK